MTVNHAQTIQNDQAVAVVVYGKPNCVQCTATERKLTKENINFTKVNVAEDPTALNFILSLGHQQAPVVYVATETGDVHWSGFDVKKIAEHITEREAA